MATGITSKQKNHFGGVIVSVLASSEVDNGFQLRSGQTKDYEMYFSTRYTALLSKIKD